MARRRRAKRSPEHPRDCAADTLIEILRRRARKASGKGDYRKAAVAFRELVAQSGDAKTWALLGDSLRRARRPTEAAHAFKQAVYLHRRAGAHQRAHTVARLLTNLGC